MFTGAKETLSRSTKDSERQVSEEIRHIYPDAFSKNPKTSCNPVPSHEHLPLIGRENRLNWISLVGELQGLLNAYSKEVINRASMDFAY